MTPRPEVSGTRAHLLLLLKLLRELNSLSFQPWRISCHDSCVPLQRLHALAPVLQLAMHNKTPRSHYACDIQRGGAKALGDCKTLLLFRL